jgi:hypothetical protein
MEQQWQPVVRNKTITLTTLGRTPSHDSGLLRKNNLNENLKEDSLRGKTSFPVELAAVWGRRQLSFGALTYQSIPC